MDFLQVAVGDVFEIDILQDANHRTDVSCTTAEVAPNQTGNLTFTSRRRPNCPSHTKGRAGLLNSKSCITTHMVKCSQAKEAYYKRMLEISEVEHTQKIKLTQAEHNKCMQVFDAKIAYYSRKD